MVSALSGEYADGRTAALQRVRVTFDGQFLLLQGEEHGGEVARWSRDDVRIDALQERDVFHLQSGLDPDAVLTLRGSDVLESLQAMGLDARTLPRDTGRRMVYAGAFIAAIAAVATLVWLSATPVSKAIARQVPMETERRLLGSIERRLAGSYCESEAASAALSDLSSRLLHNVDADELEARVHVLNLEMPNAFALPGGTIVLTRGLMEYVEGPDEVAGVLAHELEHVRQRHVMTGVVRGTLLSALWAVSVGDFSGLMVIDPTTAFQLATLQFSREDEAEADRGAVVMLRRARIDSGGLSLFFERLSEEEGEMPEWLSSHPASGERAALASDPAPSSELAPALDPQGWAAVRSACDDAPAPEATLSDLFL